MPEQHADWDPSGVLPPLYSSNLECLQQFWRIHEWCIFVRYYRRELQGAAAGWTPWKILRRAGFALFGVFNATEPNTNFAAELASAVGGDQATKIILVCNSKGDMSRPPPPNNAELWHEVYQSR
jgi:hypothetical protein